MSASQTALVAKSQVLARVARLERGTFSIATTSLEHLDLSLAARSCTT